MPASDVLIYYLDDDSRVIVRPSGTEPKLKCYYEIHDEIGDGESFEAADARGNAALDALVAHLEAAVPWGAEISITPGALGEACSLDASDDASVIFKEAFSIAYGTTTVEMGVGGSIPFVAAFEAAYPNASILLTGVMDPTSQIHAPNESQSLSDLESGILGEAIALRMLAGLPPKR